MFAARAVFQQIFREGLLGFEAVAAVAAFIFVDGHSRLESLSGVVGDKKRRCRPCAQGMGTQEKGRRICAS